VSCKKIKGVVPLKRGVHVGLLLQNAMQKLVQQIKTFSATTKFPAVRTGGQRHNLSISSTDSADLNSK